MQATADRKYLNLYIYDTNCKVIGDYWYAPGQLSGFPLYSELKYAILFSTLVLGGDHKVYEPFFDYTSHRYGVGGESLSGFGQYRKVDNVDGLQTVEIKFHC